MDSILELLLTGVFAIHLLAVNVGMAAPLVCIWLHWRAGRRNDPSADRVGLRLAWGSMTLTGVGLFSGALLLAILWLQGETSYFQAMGQFSRSKYWFTFLELLFYFACMVAYVRLWKRCLGSGGARFLHALIAVAAATNLLYHFPPLMAVLATIPTRREWMGVEVDAAMFRTMVFFDPEICARVLHVWLSSVAVTGVALMALSLQEIRESNSPQAKRLAVIGARIALAPTLLQILVGVWVFLTVPRLAQSALMGGDLLGTGLLAFSVLLALGLMHLLATAALGDVERAKVFRSMAVLFLLVLCMSGVLRRVRIESRPPSSKAAVYEKSRVDFSTRLSIE